MGAPSKDDIARIVEVAKNDCSMLFVESYVEISSVIVALADEIERLRAERIEVLALLDDPAWSAEWPWSFCSYPLTEECRWTSNRRHPCVQHQRRALVAKLRGAP